MMIPLKLLAVFIFTTLLTGCVEGKLARFGETLNNRVDAVIGRVAGSTMDNPCVLGRVQIADCYYVMTIINPSDGPYVVAKTSIKVCRQNRASGNPAEDCDKFIGRQNDIYFRVKDSNTLNFQKGNDYEFVSDLDDKPTDVVLCVVMNDETGVPDKTKCDPRTRPLKTVGGKQSKHE